MNRMFPHISSAWIAGLVLALGATASGCVEFNECEGTRSARIGTAAMDLDLRESVVRTQETAVGNFVADALFAVADALCVGAGVPCPDLALQNAGGLRQETACGTREAIEAGALYQQDITDLMPFENQLVVITLTGADVLRALERGVSSLGQPGEGAQAGSFLHVAGVSIEVDCAHPAQQLLPDQSGIAREGERVVRATLTSRGREEPIDPAAEYEVVTNSFIGAGNDGFLSFYFLSDDGRVLTDGNGVPIQRLDRATDVVKDPNGTEVSDRLAVIEWVRAHDAAGLGVGRPPEGRIRTEASCYGELLAGEP